LKLTGKAGHSLDFLIAWPGHQQTQLGARRQLKPCALALLMRGKTKLKSLIFLLTIIFLFKVSCNRATEHVICTTEHVMINITVTDENGMCVDSVIIKVSKKSDNTFYDLSGYNEPGGLMTQQGLYTIFHDGYLREVQGKIERIVVSGEKDTLNFLSEIDVSGDDCHVLKITGPDTVLIE
jgi:hypothetical protein